MSARERIGRTGRGACRGAAIGLVAAALVGGLMQFQGMFGGVGSSWLVFLGSATAVGVVIGVVTDHRPHELAAAVSGGAVVGLLGWLLFALTLDPLLRATAPTWTVAAAAIGYRTLVGAVLQGALTGAALYGLRSVWRPRAAAGREPVAPLTRVVVIGGGFAGVSAAQRFERLVLRGVPVDVTVISDSNFLLFTPMLAEVASSALEPRAHQRAGARGGRPHPVPAGAVEHVDTGRAAPSRDGAGADSLRPSRDRRGSVPSFLDMPGVEEHAFTLKDLADATRLRDHVLGAAGTVRPADRPAGAGAVADLRRGGRGVRGRRDGG